MTLPLGHRTRRVKKPRGTTERTDARGSHNPPPSTDTHALAETRRADDLDLWDENDLAREFTRLQANLNRSEEIADGIREMLKTRGVRVSRPKRRARRKAIDRDALPPLNHSLWKRAARQGIGHVHFGTATDRKIAVSIDGAKEFLLSTAEADLLAVLLDDHRRDAEGFPPFRSFRDLAKSYGARRGNRAGVHAVRVGINRLQWQLMIAGGLSPGIVEVRHGSARLRINRRANGRG